MAGQFKVIAFKPEPGGAVPVVRRYDTPAGALAAALSRLLEGYQVRLSDNAIEAFRGQRDAPYRLQRIEETLRTTADGMPEPMARRA
jgi:hypothetical protein